MDALAGIFAASLAVQQVLEAVSMTIEKKFNDNKKAVLVPIGFALGLAMAYGFQLNLMAYFQVPNAGGHFDKIVTALILSAGTEGMNSVVKFLKYVKEDKKATAAETVQSVRRQAAATGLTALSDAEMVLEALRRADRRPAPPAAAENGVETPALAAISRK